MDLDAYRTLGRSGLRVSAMTLGAMTFGDGSWGADAETSFAILDRFVERGGNAVDTANGYTAGRSEETIGAYLAARPGLRDRLVIETRFSGNMFPGDPNAGGSGRKAIILQVEESLRRLGTDYIDLYWQHNYDRHTPLEETMSTVDDLVRAGKVRYFGLSDAPAWAVARMATIAEFRGWAGVAALQIEYSLLQRSVEGELFGVARELGLGITPWSPLAGGVLTGKYSREETAPAGSGRVKRVAGRMTEQSFAVLDVLLEVSDRLSLDPATVALAWVRQKPEVTSTIIGVRSVEQLERNLASLEAVVPEDAMAELDRATVPRLDFPADLLRDVAIPWQQGGTTVNGVASERYRLYTNPDRS